MASPLESAGAIPMPEDGHYVVYMENMGPVLTTALANNSQITVLGRTSPNAGSAFVVSVSPCQQARKKMVEDFFSTPVGRTGLSAALMAVVERRS